MMSWSLRRKRIGTDPEEGVKLRTAASHFLRAAGSRVAQARRSFSLVD